MVLDFLLFRMCCGLAGMFADCRVLYVVRADGLADSYFAI